jgi:hypothetical protein
MGSQSYSINLGIPQLPENKSDIQTYTEFVRIYSAIRALAGGLDSYTGALQADTSIWSAVSPDFSLDSMPRRLYIPTTDNLTNGCFVGLYNNAGVLTAALAQSGVRSARGFSTGVYNAGGYAEIILYGLHKNVSGLTPGAMYYLSSVTPGGFTSSSGTQPLGYALSPTRLWFSPTVS